MLSVLQIFIGVVHFYANYTLVIRWYSDNLKDPEKKARAIQVGVPPMSSLAIDSETGLADGIAVPEADRDVNTRPICLVRRHSIPAHPVVDAQGQKVISSH